MARRSTDEDILAMSRAAREIEQLDDPAAQARVATYLYLRFTSAGESIAVTGDRPRPPAQTSAPAPQLTLPEVVTPAPATAPHNAPDVAPVPEPTPAGNGPDGAAAAPESPPGWGLAGDGSSDDAGLPAMPKNPPAGRVKARVGKPAAPPPKVTQTGDGWDIGGDEEVEVKL